MPKGSLFSTSLPTLVICCLFDNSHSHRCEVTCHCGIFKIYFSSSVDIPYYISFRCTTVIGHFCTWQGNHPVSPSPCRVITVLFPMLYFTSPWLFYNEQFDVEHLSRVSWPSVCLSSLEKCLFSCSAHFLIGWIVVMLSCLSSLYILDISPYWKYQWQISSSIQ